MASRNKEKLTIEAFKVKQILCFQMAFFIAVPVTEIPGGSEQGNRLPDRLEEKKNGRRMMCRDNFCLWPGRGFPEK